MNSIEKMDSNNSSLSPLLLNMENDTNENSRNSSRTPSGQTSPRLIFDKEVLFSYSSDKFFLNRIKNLFKNTGNNGVSIRADVNTSESYSYLQVSKRYVKLMMWPFGIRLLCTAFMWDHFVNKYHSLLEVYSDNPAQIVILYIITELFIFKFEFFLSL